MKRFLSFLFLLSALILPLALSAAPPAPAVAAEDAWWDAAWPYRIPVTVGGDGVAEAAIDFTAAFAGLGLNDALLDVRALRVVPYDGVTPRSPIPHAESYTTMLADADDPQIGWSDTGVYWRVNDGEAVGDGSRFSQGSGSLKATIENLPGGYGYPGVELLIAGGLTDWRDYETFLYDVWPQVNASALDQAPDLYSFKLYDTAGCDSDTITQGGPALALDRWNAATISLKPLHTCTTPELNPITRLEFHTRDNETVSGNSGLWDDGDVLTLWLDNVRLMDQDGGTIRWATDGSASHYYVYFDVIEHEGHPLPELADLGEATLTAVPGAPEAGGYYHQIEGAAPGDWEIWAAPPVEKIGRDQAPPVATAPLRIQAARDEYEPFQLAARAAAATETAVSISDFRQGDYAIPAGNVTLHRVDYVTLTRLSDDYGRLGPWPDPLYPIAPGGDVAFPAGQNQPLWFTVHVPRDAAPGLYTATVSIGGATIPVELEVWDFALPREIHLAGEWGFGWSQVVERYQGTVNGSPQDGYWTLVDALYEEFAAHRLTPKGVGWPAGLNYPGGVAYDCATGELDPDAWEEWDFHTLAQKYLAGDELANAAGFPSFLIRGPSSNWPPASRPASFCGQSRGDDPPGNAAYNDKWFAYWTAVSDYVAAANDYAAKGYYHIVNEPQTFADYDIVAYLAAQTKAHAPAVRILVSEQVEPAIYANSTYPGAQIDVWMPTISNYQVTRAQERQTDHGESVWWYFLYGDRPPLPNPTVIDRTGLEARITPWLAWLERVEGLVYYSTTAWEPNPWQAPWHSGNNGNGDGFLFYPPRDGAIAYDPADPQSNRLVPSIRWELLREGMEDYEYLWLLNGGDPEIGAANEADALAAQFIDSRTAFSRVPTDLYAARAAVAAALTGANPAAAKDAPGQVARFDTFSYTLTYSAGDTAHTVTISDTVPAETAVLTAAGSVDPPPTVTGQTVTWEAPVRSRETITLTITAEAVGTGVVENTAVFSGPTTLSAAASVFLFTDQTYLPLVSNLTR